MNYFLLDASAAVKNYITEDGTPQMQYFFTQVVPERMMICMSVTVGEILSKFKTSRNIKKNDPDNEDGITEGRYKMLIQKFESEVSQNPKVTKVYSNNSQISDSWHIIDRYSMKPHDALILQCSLDKAKELRTEGHDLILVCSDKDFLKVARSEGLRSFNPQTNKIAYLDVLINS